jgi:hypothetical protein
VQGGGAVNGIIKRAVQTDSNVAGSSIDAINGSILVQEFVKHRSWTEAVKELEEPNF